MKNQSSTIDKPLRNKIIYKKDKQNENGVISVKRIFRRNYKVILGIAMGTILLGMGVYATTTISSSDISYDNKNSGLAAEKLNDAVDELYKRATTLSSSKPCRVIRGIGTTTSDEIKCGAEEFYILYSSGDSIHALTKYPIEGGVAETGDPVSPCLSGPSKKSAIANPSYAQNKNCGNTSFLCGDAGEDFSQKYKEVLNRIGLSNDISVVRPSLTDLNKSGCKFSLTPVANNDNGSCSTLPWLNSVTLIEKIGGPPDNRVIASTSGLSYTSAYCNSNLLEAQKLIVKIPLKNILL